MSSDTYNTGLNEFHSLIAPSLDGFMLSSLTGTIVEVNESFCRLVGYTRDELLTMHIADLDAVDSREDVARRLEALIRSGSLRFETQLRRKDGAIIDVEVSANYSPLHGGRFVSVARDITELKRNQLALREREQQFRSLIETAPEAIFIQSGGRFLYLNSRMVDLLGAGRAEELVGSEFMTYVAPEFHEVIRERIEYQNKTGAPSPPMEQEYLRVDGSRVPVETTAVAIQYQGENAHLVFIRDISRRREFEQSIFKANEHLTAMLNALPDLLFEIDRAGRIYEFRAPVPENLFVPPETFLGKTIDQVLPPDAVSVIKTAVTEAGETGLHRGATYSLPMPSGTEWFELSISTKEVPDSQERFLIIARDITERKRTEEALKEREERLRRLSENLASGMVYQINSGRDGMQRQFSYISPVVERFHGLTVEAVQRDPMLLYNQVTEKDRILVREQEAVAFATMTTLDVEVVVNLPSGENRWRRFVSTPHIHPDGSVLWDGIEFDITERKQAEEKLRLSEEKFRSVVESSPLAMHFYRLERDGSLIFTGANPAAERILGISHHTLLNKRLEDAFPNLKTTGIPEMYRSVAQGVLGPQSFEIAYHDSTINGIYDVTAYRTGTDTIAVDFMDITSRKQAEEALRESNQMFAIAFNNAPFMATLSRIDDGTFLDVNQRFQELSGFSREDVIGKTSVETGWLTQAERNRLVEIINRDGKARELDLTVHSKSGTPILIKFWGEIITVSGQKRLLAFALDITEYRELEAQLVQAQKLDSIGQLAGGVAHEFNNILQVITGFSSLSLMEIPQKTPLHQYVSDMLRAAKRGEALTRSLLAFSRKQPTMLTDLELNQLTREFMKLLTRILREDIELEVICCEDPLPVRADRGQIEQILMNLVTNSRDAMPHGGRLTITTRQMECDAGQTDLLGLEQPGRYACITARDTGTGISREIQGKIFDPFFTTKEVGKGTGLGLATVYGIVKRHKGAITVHSEHGTGSTFSIFLPLIDKQVNNTHQHYTGHTELSGGTETILIAEDDDALRNLTASVLRTRGYQVIEAQDGVDAVEKFQTHADRIQLVILDGIMPRKNGRLAFDEMILVNPSLKAIFISGYSGDLVDLNNLDRHSVLFLQKPVSVQTYLRKVRELLDAS